LPAFPAAPRGIAAGIGPPPFQRPAASADGSGKTRTGYVNDENALDDSSRGG
jgi:hypothetical protein